MTNAIRTPNGCKGAGRSEHGTATVELAIILPVILMILFAIVDIGMLIDARLVVTRLAQLGGSLGSRDLPTSGTPPAFDPIALISLLQKAASPLDFEKDSKKWGKIYVWKIDAGTASSTLPTIHSTTLDGTLKDRNLNDVTGSITSDTLCSVLGGSAGLCDSLTYKSTNGMAEIPEVTVVEVFYKYQFITPLVRFIPSLPIGSDAGFILSSRAVFP